MILVVGDVHGCMCEFRDLLEDAGLGPGDTVIALGDIVDRGPASSEVVEWFRKNPGSRSLLGNHERKHVRAAAGLTRPSLSQLIVKEELGEEYPALIGFIRNFPLHVEVEGALLTHAFFEPGVPLTEQKETVLCGTLAGEAHLKVALCRPWYELYEGPPIIVGHRDYRRDGQPFIFRDRVYGLDTGAVRGARLTGLLLPSFRIVSVPSRADYWSAQASRYAFLRRAPAADEKMLWREIEAAASLRGPRAQRLARILEAARTSVRRLVEAIRSAVEKLRSEHPVEDDLSRAIDAAARGALPIKKYLHAAREGRIAEDMFFQKRPTPRLLLEFLANVESFTGVLPELSEALGHVGDAEACEEAEGE